MGKIFGVCRSVIIVFTLMFFSSLSWAQKTTSTIATQKLEITGIVKTEDGDPIAGAIVRLRGTNIETETNAEGKYTFNVKKGDKIQFVYRGFKTSTAIVRKSNILNVKMKEDDVDLHDVIISFNCHSSIGCTIDTASVERIELNESHIVDVGYPLAFSVEPRPSEVYRNPETILKDVESLSRNGNYTYVVDGVQVSEETFRMLNQNDVESVDIYKHTDVYNARFGNKENQSRISLNVR
ncbi:carboxypeptidase-like regulatory domain-containing protein [Flavobacterium sp. xlx-214]|uniref:carboxypeptidase-like regulatory domain-containing protein n=1 Tax=unclassified Flavobacterium TaxID=196869 RepID=UPI0013D8CD60|nr:MULTISPECIES: carboxypeptidase-like regulatory domain-containing protein [unclassified Flavobacterium]MBA5792912.1 carboxypeptidase-like regulatory domain-containing protein [Flavobacterium sp. xlx-221]QMI84754.1 carboxypeptidase-like regulatory domain-containing protein [Flavobacterium sp. xlx-214]